MMHKEFDSLENRVSNSSSLIVTVPHSGRLYEEKFLDQTSLDLDELRKTEDHYIDLLFDDDKLNYNFVKANFPRIFVDVNRSPLEIDQTMWKINSNIIKTNYLNSSKVQAGIGVIPKYSFNGMKIYNTKLSFSEARSRLLNYYFPYHKVLKFLIKTIKFKYKYLVALDCHSMASVLVSEDTDIILGNNFGKNSSMALLDSIAKIFFSYGYRVKKNYLFKGGFITKQYGKPLLDNHFVQIEINKKIYINEENLKIKQDQFNILKICFSKIIDYINTGEFVL